MADMAMRLVSGQSIPRKEGDARIGSEPGGGLTTTEGPAAAYAGGTAETGLANRSNFLAGTAIAISVARHATPDSASSGMAVALASGSPTVALASTCVRPTLDVTGRWEASNTGGKLAEASDQLKIALKHGNDLRDVRNTAFSLFREAAQQNGITVSDADVARAHAMADGKLVTGDPAMAGAMVTYLNALSLQGAHVLAPTSAAAASDHKKLRPVYEALGMSVGYVHAGVNHEDRAAEYGKDITFAEHTQAAFDMMSGVMGRTPHFALIDESGTLLMDDTCFRLSSG